MTKKDFFSKLKNYNNELEQVLEKKVFSSNIKNLLLNMFYKIEVSYKDYQKVKRTTKEQNDLMQELISIINKSCNKIELVEPNSQKGKVLKKYNLHSISDRAYKKIISYPVEADLLYALADIEKKYFYINEDYYIEKQAFEKMLNIGYCINLKEILRDFSGWSWQVEAKEIENINYNLIYQILRILVGFKFLDEWKSDSKKDTDYIVKLQEKLSHAYGTQNAIMFFKKLYITLSMILLQKNNKLKKELYDERKKALEEIEVVKNKAQYLEKITNNKKKMTKQIKNIDEILNDEELLKQELEKRKQKLGKKSNLLNDQYLRAILSQERRELLEKIQKSTSLMNPKNYVANKRKIESKYEKINEVLESLEKKDENTCIIELQQQFLKCLEVKANNTNNKKELIDLIYFVRYYLYIPVDENKTIKDLDKLRMQINKIQEILIVKCINLKLLNIISLDNEINNKIVKKIISSHAVDMENLELEIKPKYNKLKVNVYEREELENSFEIETEGAAERVNIKTDKKFRLFIK